METQVWIVRMLWMSLEWVGEAESTGNEDTI